VSIIDRRVPTGPPEKYDTAEELLSWMSRSFAQFGDIYSASIYGNHVYVITSPDYVAHVLLRNWRNYIRKGYAIKRISMLLGNGIISSNGEFWAAQRRMIQPAFTRKAVESQTGVMIDATRELLAQWLAAAHNRTRVNVTRDVSRTVLKITLTAIFGADYATIAPHFEIVSEESRDLEFAQMFTALGKVIIEVAERRRRDRIEGSDILGWVMQARDRDRGLPMPDAQLAREIMTLIVAGHETTASVLNWTWYLLSRHSAVDQHLAEELAAYPAGKAPDAHDLARFPYAAQVVEEAMRLYPPLWLMTRRAVGDDHIGGYFVPAGTEIYISPYFLQRNPGYWRTPEHFDPARTEESDSDEEARDRLKRCPFGAGPRNCVGEQFARVEMQIHLMMIAKHLRLRADDERAPQVVANLNLLSKDDFIMRPELRASG
jgi:cytochrome P450